MSDANMAVSSAVPVTVKQTDYKNLRTGEDFRPQAAEKTKFPPQPAVRAENSDSKGA